MAKLEDELLEKFSDALLEDPTIPDDLAQDIVAELRSANGANAERLADAFRQAIAREPK
jgi:hypothetical protein